MRTLAVFSIFQNSYKRDIDSETCRKEETECYRQQFERGRNAILETQILKILRGGMPPDPPRSATCSDLTHDKQLTLAAMTMYSNNFNTTPNVLGCSTIHFSSIYISRCS